MLNIFIFILLASSFSDLKPEAETGTLEVEVQNINSEEGMIWLGLYKSEADFLIKEKATLVGVKVASKSPIKIKIPDLAYGEYALAVFHDENNNGEMDRNLVGIPSEPFAFSQPPASKFRIPKFEEVKFTFDNQQVLLVTQLKKWWQS